MLHKEDLSPQIQRRIQADRAAHWINSYRCNDADIIRRENNSHDEPTLWRPAFVRDVEKIIHTPAYNRYTGKTQVFSFHRNDDLSHRGLHVQLVTRIARDIGSVLGLNTDLIEAIGLGHDIGHTPFGHAGERCLNDAYHARTGRYFWHNVHSVRVLDGLYGRNISLQTLDGVLCHNGEYEKQRFVPSDRTSFEEFDAIVESCYVRGEETIDTLSSMTLEGCLVRICDIIAYVGKDRQDALRAGILDPDTQFETGSGGDYNARILRRMAVDIIEHSYGENVIEMSGEAFEELRAAKRENYRLIYTASSVEEQRDAVITPMFERLYDRLLSDLNSRNETTPIYRHHITDISEYLGHYGKHYDLGEPNQIVVDYIASMTDDYFIELYRFLFPEDERELPIRSYFDKMRSAAASTGS